MIVWAVQFKTSIRIPNVNFYYYFNRALWVVTYKNVLTLESGVLTDLLIAPPFFSMVLRICVLCFKLFVCNYCFLTILIGYQIHCINNIELFSVDIHMIKLTVMCILPEAPGRKCCDRPKSVNRVVMANYLDYTLGLSCEIFKMTISSNRLREEPTWH